MPDLRYLIHTNAKIVHTSFYYQICSYLVLPYMNIWRLFNVHNPSNAYANFSKFRKTNISYPLIRSRTLVYQGVRNISFSENFAYVLNERTLINLGEAWKKTSQFAVFFEPWF